MSSMEQLFLSEARESNQGWARYTIGRPNMIWAVMSTLFCGLNLSMASNDYHDDSFGYHCISLRVFITCSSMISRNIMCRISVSFFFCSSFEAGEMNTAPFRFDFACCKRTWCPRKASEQKRFWLDSSTTYIKIMTINKLYKRLVL